MKPSFKIFSIYLFVLFLLIIFGSCNSVKRVLKDPVKYKQVTDKFVESGGCVNDTITVTNTKDSIITDTVTQIIETKSPCPDFTQTLSDGTIVTSKDGNLSIKYKLKNTTIRTTRTITNTVTDKTLQNLLKEQRDSARTALLKTKLELKDTQTKLSEAKRKNLYTWIGIGVIVLLSIGLKTGLFKKFIPFI